MYNILNEVLTKFCVSLCANLWCEKLKLVPVGFVSWKPPKDFSHYSITLVNFRLLVLVEAKITRQGEGDSNFVLLKNLSNFGDSMLCHTI